MSATRSLVFIFAAALPLPAACGCAVAEEVPPALLQRSTIDLEPCDAAGTRARAFCGSYEVFEDRDVRSGRTIALNVVVLPARAADADEPPVFFLAGGPGGAATDQSRALATSWMRDSHDIVLVDQRGTGRSNPLGCDPPGSEGGLQGYLERSFGSPAHYARCREQLESVADLRLYTTPIAMDDLDEVRRALGYEQIILYGGSYGSRAALVYMRRHPHTVYAAILSGVVPTAFKNPLYHAREAQNALDAIFAECAADAACGEAFPDLAREFDELLARLETAPASATVRHPRTGRGEVIRVSREAFADGLRVFMYYMPRSRRVPLLIHRAWQGDFDAVAQELLQSSFGLASALQMGMLLSVTCSEDVSRISPEEIGPETDGTFLGDGRVRQQMAACRTWVRGELPGDYGDPVSVDVPVLLFSGTLDPVTGPRWGAEAAAHLPGSLHVVMPGAHGVSNDCVGDISRRFLDSGTVEGLDTSCVNDIRLPPFDLR